jgi:hypothetical protein
MFAQMINTHFITIVPLQKGQLFWQNVSPVRSVTLE